MQQATTVKIDIQANGQIDDKTVRVGDLVFWDNHSPDDRDLIFTAGSPFGGGSGNFHVKKNDKTIPQPVVNGQPGDRFPYDNKKTGSAGADPTIIIGR